MAELVIGAAILILFAVMFFFGAILEDNGTSLKHDWPEE